jgi:hypothetical protein
MPTLVLADNAVDCGFCPLCGRERLTGDWPLCDDGSGKHGHSRPHGGTRLQAIHPSERAVVYRNARTGEIRYPARNDSPVPPVYARQGYERCELESPQAIRQYEKETGRMHERSHYDSANDSTGAAERAVTAPALIAPKITGLD